MALTCYEFPLWFAVMESLFLLSAELLWKNGCRISAAFLMAAPWGSRTLVFRLRIWRLYHLPKGAINTVGDQPHCWRHSNPIISFTLSHSVGMNGHISYANRLPFEGQSGRRTFPTDNYTAKADNNCVSPFTTPAEFAFLRILRHPEEEPPTWFLLPVAPEDWSVWWDSNPHPTD